MPDDVELAVVVVEGEDERPDGALLLAHAERHHHGVECADALDLEHPGPFPGEVGRGGLLGDHALGAPGEPAARALGIVGRRRELDVVAVDRRREPAAALLVRQVEQHLVPVRQQVEGDVRRGRLLREHLHARLRRVDALAEQVELLDPVDHHDQLAVEH